MASLNSHQTPQSSPPLCIPSLVCQGFNNSFESWGLCQFIIKSNQGGKTNSTSFSDLSVGAVPVGGVGLLLPCLSLTGILFFWVSSVCWRYQRKLLYLPKMSVMYLEDISGSDMLQMRVNPTLKNNLMQFQYDTIPVHNLIT